MKKKLLTFTLSIALIGGIFGIFQMRTVYASCSCAFVCSTRCEYNCSNCNAQSGECYDQAWQCCIDNYIAVGGENLPACGPSN